MIYYHSECWQGNLRERIAAASCWHFCYLTGLTCFPPWELCTRRFPMSGSLLSSYALSLPSARSLGVWRPDLCSCCRTQWGAGKDRQACGVLSTRSLALFLVAKVNGKEDGASTAWKTLNELHPTVGSLHVRQPSRPKVPEHCPTHFTGWFCFW